jgi:DNA processing protein
MLTKLNAALGWMNSGGILGKSQLDSFRVAWLRLARTKNVGAKTFVELMKIYGDPQRAIDNIDMLAERGGARGKKLVPSIASIEKEIADTKKYGAEIILACDEAYPKILTHIPDYPPVLIAKGDINLLNKHKFAVIGARNSTINGNKLSHNFAKEIAYGGYVIVSGLAKGIDSYAHKGSIDHGTIAVIAGGINHIYPKENIKLYEEIYEKGVVITEQPINLSVLAQHFPQRNRIIAGLSLGVLVIEASQKSGTLITSKFALDYNREVYAVPGSPLDSKSQGTNELLKQGANIALSSHDILQDLNQIVQEKTFFASDKLMTFTNGPLQSMASDAELELHRSKLTQSLSHSPVLIEDIIEQLGIPMNILNYLLIELELAGKIYRMSGNKVCRQYIDGSDDLK